MDKNFDIKNYSGDYFIGLDIGTNSVGWAVVDENMNLLKYHKQNAWGSRLFDTALTAVDRRTKRGLRRRYARRRVRIGLLNELMAPFVNDESFFQRIKESFYQINDRTQKNHYNLFNDDNFTDEEYNIKYPTIYHLRYELINSEEKFDPRLVYLAIHHILKYRGNFLYENLNFGESDNLSCKFDNLITNFKDNHSAEFEFLFSTDEIIDILLDKEKTNRQKIKELKYNNNDDFLKLILGLKANLNNIFDGNDFGEQKDISLNEENVEEKISSLVGFEEILNECCSFYNLIQYRKIMQDSTCVSQAMIKRYEQYASDLKQLRDLLKRNLPNEEYQSYFRDLNKAEYKNYALYTKRGGNCKYEDFKKALLAKLKKIKTENPQDLTIIENITSKLNDDNFLKKLRTSDNGVFPMQVHLYELEKIINNQAKYYPYLEEIKEKIITLFKFRIDYFVGPLAKRNETDFGWISKKVGYENVTVTPLNYKEVVDFEACQEKFITRMTRDCSYILGEKALPKHSIYYTAFNLLNELNNIRYTDSYGEKPLSENTRNKIFARLLETNIIKKQNIEIFIQQETMDKNVQVTLSNNEKLNNNLKSYKDFVNILGKVDASNIEMIEKCIEWITIFGENKQVLKLKIEKNFKDRLSAEEINRISRLSYTGWGRLSKKLITGLKVKVGEEYKNILEIMQEPGYNNYYKNFNSIYSKYGFKTQVEKLNKNIIQGSPQEVISSLACSPAIKRGINQAYKIICEIIKLFKRPPAKIFIEFARDEQQKGTKGLKASRKDQLKEKYDAILKNHKDLMKYMNDDAYNSLNKIDDESFSKEKFLLYYLQAGKCAYSGKNLELSRLQDYHVDHIIPRSLIKDDSLDNKVLVLPEENERKLDDETVLKSVQDKMKHTWIQWKEMGLLTAEKFKRLTRTHLTDNDKNRFINRQIVETRQIIINTAEVLQNFFNSKGYNVEIKPVRAKLNSQFRDMFGYFKGLGGREINDFHHAKDAYISVFLGRYIEQNFENISTNFAVLNTQKYSKKQPYGYGFVLNSLKDASQKWGDSLLTNEIALANFDKNYYYSNILYTKMTTTKVNGELYDATRYKNKKNTEIFGVANKNGLISLGKKYDKSQYLSTDDYGGYSSSKPAYFAIIKNLDKKDKYSFIEIPLRFVILNDENVVKEYLSERLKTTNFKIIKYVPKQQLFKTGNMYFRITGTDDRSTVKQLVFGRRNKQLYEFIYHVFNDLKSIKIPENVDKQLFISDYFNKNYNLFKELYLTHIINNFPDNSKNIYNKIIKGFEKYENLDVNEKIKLIKELLKITQCNTVRSNDKDFEVRLKFAIDLKNSYLIYQSPTGLRQKTVKISDL
ncbi:MAG: type II CRISPR RNA-guided endonuclease Cas9 [Clostridia bacterium]|nr:type II CRISPR RNA-guided endonuclease Cas9 [Clostridia bacterium]